MAVFRVERTRDYTVMSNHHLKDGELSLKAKGLLSMMLSLPDEWNYTTRGLACICKEGVDAIGKALKELETAGYIVRRQLRGANGRITDIEYTIYEKPHRPEPPQPGTTSPDTPPPDTDPPDTENPYMVPPDMEEPCTEKREDIQDQIEYELICTPSNREQVNEFVEIMLEVAMTRSPTIRIGRDAEYPTAFVQQRFEQLNSTHIQKVLDAIQENTTRVWNTKAYLLAALFNAPSSTDNHYVMLVNHDLYHDG